MQIPVMTKQLARPKQGVINSSHLGGISQVQQQPGNPYDIVIQRFDNATAYMARAITFSGWWNRVIGLETEDSDRLDDILAFFRTHHLHRDVMVDIRKGAFFAPGSHRYIAYVNEISAAMAGLYIHVEGQPPRLAR